MFQPRVKLEFVRRYISPADGWRVFVDIDPSEEGLTGGPRSNDEAELRRCRMKDDASGVRADFQKLGVTVGGKRRKWFDAHRLPHILGDRDIVALHPDRKV